VNGGLVKTAHCPSGTFVTRVDSYDNGAHASGIVFYCAQPTLTGGATSYSVTLTQMASGQALAPDAAFVSDFKSDGDASYTRWGDGGTKFDLACQSNEVVVGFDVRQGAWLNAIAPICAAVSVVYM
jgi:hypothetical protein